MLTVIKQHEDRNVIVYDYYIEDRQNVYVDTGHITVKSNGWVCNGGVINDQNEKYLKQALTALVMKKKSEWRCLSRYDKSCAWRKKNERVDLITIST